MHGAQIAVGTTAVVIVNGSTGDDGRPVRATVKPTSGTVYLGGPDVDATHGFALASTDPPMTVELVSDRLYCYAASSLTVHVLASDI